MLGVEREAKPYFLKYSASIPQQEEQQIEHDTKAYDELLSAGVKIYERQEAVLHAKTALIDGVWSTIGSCNLDWLSFAHNQEVNAIVLGQEFGNQMKAMYDKDIVSSRLVTLENWRKRSVVVRLKEFGARLLARWI